MVGQLLAVCSWVGRRGVAAALALLCGCGAGPAPAAPRGLVAAEEQRLLQPFQTPRDVIAHHVEITLSPNFLGSPVDEADIDRLGSPAGNRVALPGIDKTLHSRQVVRGADGTVETFVNERGGIERPLRLGVGGVRFQALRGIVVRVLPSGAAMTLDVVARGDVTVLAGSETQDMPELEVRDGVWRGQ
jgi:hypothetical protein